MSSEKARLSFANVAASALLTTGAVTRALLELSSFTGGPSGEEPSEPPQPGSVTPTNRETTLINTTDELCERMATPSRMTTS